MLLRHSLENQWKKNIEELIDSIAFMSTQFDILFNNKMYVYVYRYIRLPPSPMNISAGALACEAPTWYNIDAKINVINNVINLIYNIVCHISIFYI